MEIEKGKYYQLSCGIVAAHMRDWKEEEEWIYVVGMKDCCCDHNQYRIIGYGDCFVSALVDSLKHIYRISKDFINIDLLRDMQLKELVNVIDDEGEPNLILESALKRQQANDEFSISLLLYDSHCEALGT